MRLQLHPGRECRVALAFDGRARRDADGSLRIVIRLEGDVMQLQLPARAEAARKDGLWQHTCFEAFVAGGDAASYCEFNFSPSGEWAAYGFSGYRAGMRPLAADAVAGARWERGAGFLQLDLDLRPGAYIDRAAVLPWRVGLAAVIEERTGVLSYWALHHPVAAPDFHHPQGFTVELPPVAAGRATRR